MISVLLATELSTFRPKWNPPWLPWPEKKTASTLSAQVVSVPALGVPRPCCSKSTSQAASSPQLKRRTAESVL